MPNPFATWPVWLKWKVVLTIVWHVAWSVCASAAPPPPLVTGFFAGTQNVGLGYVDKTGWQTFFDNTAKYDGLWIHHPFGIWKPERGLPPMRFEQASLIRSLAAANPTNANLQARSDVQAFIKAARSRPRSKWLGIYVGGVQTFQPLDPSIDCPRAWFEAAKAEIQWAVDACPDLIAFDNWKGEPENPNNKWTWIINGPQGGAVMLLDWLRAQGITVASEPQRLEAATYLAGNWCVLGDAYWHQHDAANDWATHYPLGAYCHPSEAPRVLRILDLKGTDEEKLAYIESERGKTGHIPVIRITQAPGSLK